MKYFIQVTAPETSVAKDLVSMNIYNTLITIDSTILLTCDSAVWCGIRGLIVMELKKIPPSLIPHQTALLPILIDTSDCCHHGNDVIRMRTKFHLYACL